MFDHRFQFARDNKVILVDNYDQINRDILPFLGLPSQPVHDRSRKMIEDRSSFHYRNSYTILIKDGRVSEVVGAQRKDGRTGQHIDLIANFVHMLPDMNVTITNHDGALTGIPGEKRWEGQDRLRIMPPIAHSRLTSMNPLCPVADLSWRSTREKAQVCIGYLQRPTTRLLLIP